jgi:hypothetical protein
MPIASYFISPNDLWKPIGATQSRQIADARNCSAQMV